MWFERLWFSCQRCIACQVSCFRFSPQTQSLGPSLSVKCIDHDFPCHVDRGLCTSLCRSITNLQWPTPICILVVEVKCQWYVVKVPPYCFATMRTAILIFCFHEEFMKSNNTTICTIAEMTGFDWYISSDVNDNFMWKWYCCNCNFY